MEEDGGKWKWRRIKRKIGEEGGKGKVAIKKEIKQGPKREKKCSVCTILCHLETGRKKGKGREWNRKEKWRRGKGEGEEEERVPEIQTCPFGGRGRSKEGIKKKEWEKIKRKVNR